MKKEKEKKGRLKKILKENSLSKEEMKTGWTNMKREKMFKLFLSMLGYFLIINILKTLRIISNRGALLLSIPVIFIIFVAYIIYTNKHGNDEMK